MSLRAEHVWNMLGSNSEAEFVQTIETSVMFRLLAGWTSLLDILHSVLIQIFSIWTKDLVATSRLPSAPPHLFNMAQIPNFYPVLSVYFSKNHHKCQLMIKRHHISWKHVDAHTHFQRVLMTSSDTVLVSLHTPSRLWKHLW